MASAAILCLTVLCIPQQAIHADENDSDDRPPNWAQPVEKTGVPNLFKVSDALYRSAQPSAAGMKELREMGVETVISLRSFHSDRDDIGSTGLGYEHIYMKAWHPEEKELVRFLQLVTNRKRTPVLVHCQHGADRTGVMCATYRIVVQDWSREEAIREMTDGGFGFHPVWKNLVTWVNNVDVERMRMLADIELPPASNPDSSSEAPVSKVIKNRPGNE